MKQLRTNKARVELGYGPKIPATDYKERTLLSDGLYYIVRPSSKVYGTRSTGKHRVFVECPMCLKWVPAGRLHQHVVVHGDRVEGD